MRNDRLSRAMVAAMAAFATTSAVAAEPSPHYVRGRSNWIATRYPEALPPLTTYRTEPYGRSAEVDYMLGTSACRTPGRREWGGRVLNFILYNYSLTGPSREQVAGERDLCLRAGQQLAAVSAAGRAGLDKLIPAGASARGKMFSSGGNPVASYPARQTRAIPAADLDRRLIPIGQPDQARAVLGKLTPAGAKVDVIGRFAVVTLPGASVDPPAIVRRLDQYLTFLSREYGIDSPDRYITLYLAPSITAVQGTADKVHGLDVSPATLGYAYQDDLSAVALTRGAQAGTLFHELFHLLVRSSFGDIPQWLDEGLAGLYEVSAPRQGAGGVRFDGLPNWRGEVLASGWHARPTLASVVASPWFAFDATYGAQSSGFVVPDQRAALNLATARYFTLFLQERGDLPKVYRAFRERDPGADADPRQGAVDLVERTVGPLDRLQVEYDAWFLKLGGRDDSQRQGTVGKTLPNNPPPPPANAPADHPERAR